MQHYIPSYRYMSMHDYASVFVCVHGCSVAIYSVYIVCLCVYVCVYVCVCVCVCYILASKDISTRRWSRLLFRIFITFWDIIFNHYLPKAV